MRYALISLDCFYNKYGSLSPVVGGCGVACLDPSGCGPASLIVCGWAPPCSNVCGYSLSITGPSYLMGVRGRGGGSERECRRGVKRLDGRGHDSAPYGTCRPGRPRAPTRLTTVVVLAGVVTLGSSGWGQHSEITT